MFIVFDTNVWLSELALSSPSGVAVRFYVRQHGAIVLLPEVIRLELERNLTRDLRTWREAIEDNHRQLLAVFGQLKEIVLPSDEQIRNRVGEVVASLNVPVREVAFSLAAARSSFLKTIDKVAPSDKTQQFKDGVVWAHCIELLDEDDVCLVTRDKAFYEDYDYSKGLARNLREEAAACSHKLTLLPDLASLLKDIRRDIKVDERKLVENFLAANSANVTRMLDRAGFAAEGEPRVDVRLYATEAVSRLYLEFAIQFRCSDASGKARTDASLELRGDGSYDASTGEFVELRSQGEKLVYTNEEGQQKVENVVVGVGSIVLGHRSVQHTVRVPLS